MKVVKAENQDLKKLVEEIPPASLNVPLPQRRSTKKRVRRIAEPHIRSHRVKGHVYYTHCRGTDKEIYLGDADAILKAAKGGRR